jgi:glycine betaine/choline ABC-type transport system substrate-binding protein
VAIVREQRIERWHGIGDVGSRLAQFLAVLPVVLLCVAVGGCGGEPKMSVSVGSRPIGELALIGEIVAQMLERRLGAEVTRSFDLGSTPLVYQSMVMQQVDIAPENVNAILTTVLKEAINPDPVIGLERVKTEMDRIARARVLEPLGTRQRFVMIVSRETAEKRKVKTLTQASRAGSWVIGHTSEFPERPDGYNALISKYGFRLEVPPMHLSSSEAYERLSRGFLEMFAGYNTDGPLAGPEFVALEDDQNVFQPGNTCLIVRRDIISRYDRLKPLLDQLSGRFDDDRMSKLNYAVAVKKRTPAEVARQFLVEAKLE